MNRDIRFSADKSPYKVMTAPLTAPGAVYYLHLDASGLRWPAEPHDAVRPARALSTGGRRRRQRREALRSSPRHGAAAQCSWVRVGRAAEDRATWLLEIILEPTCCVRKGSLRRARAPIELERATLRPSLWSDL
jgi:hypothetical protein